MSPIGSSISGHQLVRALKNNLTERMRTIRLRLQVGRELFSALNPLHSGGGGDDRHLQTPSEIRPLGLPTITVGWDFQMSPGGCDRGRVPTWSEVF